MSHLRDEVAIHVRAATFVAGTNPLSVGKFFHRYEPVEGAHVRLSVSQAVLKSDDVSPKKPKLKSQLRIKEGGDGVEVVEVEVEGKDEGSVGDAKMMTDQEEEEDDEGDEVKPVNEKEEVEEEEEEEDDGEGTGKEEVEEGDEEEENEKEEEEEEEEGDDDKIAAAAEFADVEAEEVCSDILFDSFV